MAFSLNLKSSTRELGNAEERAAKLFTLKFSKRIHEEFGYGYHPFMLIFCGHLAVLERYTDKFKDHYEEEHYFLWTSHESARLAMGLPILPEESALLEISARFHYIAETIVGNQVVSI